MIVSLTILELIRHVSTRVHVAPAGVTPSYSNMAFQILGYILEKRAAILRQHVTFRP